MRRRRAHRERLLARLDEAAALGRVVRARLRRRRAEASLWVSRQWDLAVRGRPPRGRPLARLAGRLRALVARGPRR